MGNDQLRRMTAEDLYHFKLINEPQFSPDGTRISYVDPADYGLYLLTIEGETTEGES